jgi:hypothetical protein
MDSRTPSATSPRRISVPLDGFAVEALIRRAAREDRDPRIEAARLLREALVSGGDLRVEDKTL